MRTSTHWLAALCCLAAVAGTARARELRMGVPFPKGSRELKIVSQATEGIASATNGQVKVALSSFPPTHAKTSLAKKIFDGELDGGLVMGREIADLHREALLYAIPFTFKSYEQVDYVRRHLDAGILQKLSAGPYEALGIVEGGFAYVVSSQSLASPHDWRKRKIWVPAEDEFSKCLVGLGLKPVALPLSGVRTGWGEGTVDTVIAPLPLVIIQRWHTKTKKVFDVPFVYTYGIWIVRDDALQKLPADERKTVRENLSRSCQELSTAIRKRNKEGREVLVSWGHQFVTPDAAMQKQWKQWAKEVWQHLGKERKPTAKVEGQLRERIRAFDKKEEPKEPVQPDRR